MGFKITDLFRSREARKEEDSAIAAKTSEPTRATLAEPPPPTVERLHAPMEVNAAPAPDAPLATAGKLTYSTLLPTFRSEHTNFALTHLAKANSFDSAHEALQGFATYVADTHGPAAATEMVKDLDSVSDTLRHPDRKEMADKLGVKYWSGMPREWLREHGSEQSPVFMKQPSAPPLTTEQLYVTPHSSESGAAKAVMALQKYSQTSGLAKLMSPDGAKDPSAYLQLFSAAITLERGADGKFGLRIRDSALFTQGNISKSEVEVQVVRAMRAQLATEGFPDVSFRVENTSERTKNAMTTAEPITVAALEAARYGTDEWPVMKALILDNQIYPSSQQLKEITEKVLDRRNRSKSVEDIIKSAIVGEYIPIETPTVELPRARQNPTALGFELKTIVALENARRSGDEAAVWKALELDNVAVTRAQGEQIINKLFDIRQRTKSVAEIIESVVSPQA